MRPGSNVTITFDDGSVFRGQLGNCQMRAPETSSVEYFGSGVAHQVITRPASMVLEVYARELSEPPPLPRVFGPKFPTEPEPAPEPEDAPEIWGAYA